MLGGENPRKIRVDQQSAGLKNSEGGGGAWDEPLCLERLGETFCFGFLMHKCPHIICSPHVCCDKSQCHVVVSTGQALSFPERCGSSSYLAHVAQTEEIKASDQRPPRPKSDVVVNRLGHWRLGLVRGVGAEHTTPSLLSKPRRQGVWLGSTRAMRQCKDQGKAALSMKQI